MKQPFSQSITFKLDKAHFHECYEQSAPPIEPKNYIKAAALTALGLGLFFIEAESYYIQFFIFCLGVIEILSIKYRQTWWVWRQLMGKSANGLVTIAFDDKGIDTSSKHVNTHINWNEVNAIKQTHKGILINHNAGVNYLSNSHLGDEIVEFILNQKAD